MELYLTQHCPSDGEEQAKKRAGALVQKAQGLLPPQATALRVRRVHYECEKLGTKGVLDFGYLWRLDESQPKEMSECSGTYGMTKPEHTVHWCQSSWTDGKPLEK